MFSKANKQSQSAAVLDGGKPVTKTSVPSIISPDLRINGDMVCSGDIQIDGWVEGDIQSRNVVVAKPPPCTARFRPRTSGSAASSTARSAPTT